MDHRENTGDLLAAIWKQTFGLAVIQPEDDFFDLGGTSLIALQLVSRVHDIFAVELPVSVLARASTLKDLTEVLESVLSTNSQSRAAADGDS